MTTLTATQLPTTQLPTTHRTAARTARTADHLLVRAGNALTAWGEQRAVVAAERSARRARFDQHAERAHDNAAQVHPGLLR